MSWYRTGTVTVTNGLATVVGSGTAWSGTVDPGWVFLGPDGITYEVESVSSDTSITLATNYAGSTLAGASYATYPTQGLTRSLSQGVAQLILDVDPFLTTSAVGLFSTGSAATPSLRATSDSNTGINFAGSDSLALVTGGANRVEVDSSGEVNIGSVSDTGIWPDVTSAAKIHRAWGRLFLGGGAAFTGNFSGTQGGFVPTSTEGANWAPRDSTVFVAQDFGLMAITGLVSNENMDLSGGQPTESIAVSAFAINKQATRTVWGSYVDVQHHSGVASYGTEYAMKNLGADKTDTPYFTDGGVYGVWYAGGGDPSYGGAAANPSNTAIKIGRNASGGTTWNKGIVFVSDGLTGSDGSSGTATAIEMGYGQKIAWRAPGNYAGFEINCQVSGSGLNSSMFVGDSVIRFRGTTSLNLLELAHQSSSVNYLQIMNRATGSAPRITAIGGDADVDVEVVGRGSKGVRLIDGAGIAQIRVNTTGIGFFNTTPAARPTGVAVSAAGVHAALVTLGLITA